MEVELRPRGRKGSDGLEDGVGFLTGAEVEADDGGDIVEDAGRCEA